MANHNTTQQEEPLRETVLQCPDVHVIGKQDLKNAPLGHDKYFTASIEAVAAFLLWIVVMDARLGQAFDEQTNSLKRFTDSKVHLGSSRALEFAALVSLNRSPSSVMNHTHHHLDSMASRLNSQGLVMTVHAEIESVAANKNNNEWKVKELKMLNDESPCAGKTRGMMVIG
ncbi:hypothetical protein Tco_0996830 [Tanacetum coccineum]